MSDVDKQNTETKVRPVVGLLKIPENGDPYLEGLRCTKCEAVYTKKQTHCASCCSRDCLVPYKLSNTGTIHTYTIIRRTFPGIDVPFISTVVDLDGGGVLKGNLINVVAEPENIKFNAPIKIVYGDALGRKNKKGDRFLSYFFELA